VGQFPQQLVNGIWQGSALALFAVGYALIFGSLDIVNLAHGATYMWGAYVAFFAVTRFGLPLPIAIFAGMLGAGILAIIVDRVSFRPLRQQTRGGHLAWAGFAVACIGLAFGPGSPQGIALAIAGLLCFLTGSAIDFRAARNVRGFRLPALAPMVSSIGASIVLVNLAQSVFGPQVNRFPPDTLSNQPISLGESVVIAPVQLIVLVTSLGLIAALGVMISRTSLGRAIRAVAYDDRVARLLGINVELVYLQTFLVAGSLAGAAGALLGLAFNRIEPPMGTDVEFAGLTVIILGGMGSIPGAALAAFIVGLVRVLSVAYLDSSFRDAFVFGLLLLVLLVRPAGLFGKGRVSRA
jgi:branched-chain amino acid transport system permease protein